MTASGFWDVLYMKAFFCCSREIQSIQSKDFSRYKLLEQFLLCKVLKTKQWEQNAHHKIQVQYISKFPVPCEISSSLLLAWPLYILLMIYFSSFLTETVTKNKEISYPVTKAQSESVPRYASSTKGTKMHLVLGY